MFSDYSLDSCVAQWGIGLFGCVAATFCRPLSLSLSLLAALTQPGAISVHSFPPQTVLPLKNHVLTVLSPFLLAIPLSS